MKMLGTFLHTYLGPSEADNVGLLLHEGNGMISWFELAKPHLLSEGCILSVIIVVVYKKTAEILSVCTHPVYWKQGLGSKLIKEGEKYASRRTRPV